MKKNIFSILTLIILFTVCFISSAISSVKLISSGDENNVFEAEGTLRFEWTDEDDCDAIDGNSVKLFFIPNNPEDFGRKIVYVWPNDMSDEGHAKALSNNPSLQYKNYEEDTLKMAKRIFKNSKIKKNKAGYKEMTVKIRLKSLKPKLGCNATLLYSELVNVKEIKAPKIKLSDEKFDEKVYGNFTVEYAVKLSEQSVNIMEKPSEKSRIVKKIGKNDIVGEIQDFGEWVFVYYPNTYPDFTYGYVRKSKLKKNIRHPFENIDLFH